MVMLRSNSQKDREVVVWNLVGRLIRNGAADGLLDSFSEHEEILLKGL